MTFDEIKNIPELQIEVTPAVEYAFHFLYGVEKSGEDITEAQNNCGNHLRNNFSDEEIKSAISTAYKMIDNIDKYGVACAAWA